MAGWHTTEQVFVLIPGCLDKEQCFRKSIAPLVGMDRTLCNDFAFCTCLVFKYYSQRKVVMKTDRF